MADTIGEPQQTGPSHPPTSTQDSAIDQVEEVMTRLKIFPKKVLGSLGHLRIEKSRIKPLNDEAPKAGGKANVEAAVLASAQSSNSPKLEDPEYIAVKKLRLDTDTDDNRALAPFAHEVNLLNDLSHPSVVKVVGFVEDLEEGIAWIVFSWEKNGNLREFVRSANWELPERMSLIYDVAKGISYIHARTPPICHGDLKSLNILVNSESRAIITDFGSARTMDSGTAAAVRRAGAVAEHRITTTAPTGQSLKAEVAASGDFITMTGPAWTIRWAAPELLEGELPGLASDIWALGWICWEAITGNFPFDEENDLATILRITRGDLPALEDHTQLKQVKALCSLMGECWTLNANERPTAIRCQQVISFMGQTIPSSRNVSGGSSATRSSCLLYAHGRIQLENGVMSEAEKYFQESFVVARSAGDKQDEARAFQALGGVYQMRCEYSKAEESYIQARDTYSQLGNQLGFANSVNGLGGMYYMRCEYSKAEESYIQSRDTYSQIGNQQGFADAVKGLGDVYQMRSEYSKAEELYIQARDTYSQLGNQQGFADAVKGLGDVYRMRSEYSKAEESYIQARNTHSQLGDQPGFANSVSGLGDVYRIRSEFSKAEESYIQARDTYSQLGYQQGFANSVRCLGDVYQMRSEYSKAEESYIQARDTYSQLGDQQGFANSVNGLGDVYRMRCEYSKAEELYIQARNTYSQLGYRQGFANSVWGLGDIYRMQSEYSKAEESYIRARNTYSQIGNQLGFANSIQGLASAYSASGQYAQAEKSYLEAEAVYRRIGAMRSLANNIWWLGLLRRRQAQYGEAERLVCEASTIYGKPGLKRDVARCDTFLREVRQLMAA